MVVTETVQSVVNYWSGKEHLNIFVEKIPSYCDIEDLVWMSTDKSSCVPYFEGYDWKHKTLTIDPPF